MKMVTCGRVARCVGVHGVLELGNICIYHDDAIKYNKI